jgi:hypothetical protein
MCQVLVSDYIKDMISKSQYELQLQQIFRMLLESQTQEEIAHELNISTRTVARYYSRIEKRYSHMQRQKSDDTLFLEVVLFKNRMLKLYKGLEDVVTSKDKAVSGQERAKWAEVAANIAIDVIKCESEAIRAVKEGLVLANKSNLPHLPNNLRNVNEDQQEEEENENRKF